MTIDSNFHIHPLINKYLLRADYVPDTYDTKNGFHLCIASDPLVLAAWRAVLRRILRPAWAQYKKSL